MIKRLSLQTQLRLRFQFKNLASNQNGFLSSLQHYHLLDARSQCQSINFLNRYNHHQCVHHSFSGHLLFHQNKLDLYRGLNQSFTRSSIINSYGTSHRLSTKEDACSSHKKDHSKESVKLRRTSDLNLTQIVSIPGRMNQVLPSSLLPYAQLMRLDKQTGTALLLYPCLWSISLAALPGHTPNLEVIFLFTIGAVLMRSAGCIVNDMWDRKIDMEVERTRSRPLASGSLTMIDAWCLLSTCLTGALHILLSFDKLTILYGASSLLLVITYPLMKRITYWPQLFLGLTFNWGAMLGWSAVHQGVIDWTVVTPLYLSCIFWTLIYDTIYAYQDYNFDKKVGIKSTALRFGEKPKQWLGFFSAAMVGNLLAAGVMADQTWPYYAAVLATSLRLSELVYNLNVQDTSDCGRRFRQNQQIGVIMLVGIVLGTLLRPKKPSNQDKTLDWQNEPNSNEII